MHTLLFVMRNGYQFEVRCEKYEIANRNADLVSCDFKGIKGDVPRWFDMRDVIAVIEKRPTMAAGKEE